MGLVPEGEPARAGLNFTSTTFITFCFFFFFNHFFVARPACLRVQIFKARRTFGIL